LLQAVKDRGLFFRDGYKRFNQAKPAVAQSAVLLASCPPERFVIPAKPVPAKAASGNPVFRPLGSHYFCPIFPLTFRQNKYNYKPATAKLDSLPRRLVDTRSLMRDAIYASRDTPNAIFCTELLKWENWKNKE